MVGGRIILLFSGGEMLSFLDETLGRSKGISVCKKSAFAHIQIDFLVAPVMRKQSTQFTTKELESIIHRVATSFFFFSSAQTAGIDLGLSSFKL